jgi:hypothetical protein
VRGEAALAKKLVKTETALAKAVSKAGKSSVKRRPRKPKAAK